MAVRCSTNNASSRKLHLPHRKSANLAAHVEPPEDENREKMRQATPQLRDLARRLFALEAKNAHTSAALGEALEKSCVRLHAQLDPLIGDGGFRALLARALHLATKEFAWLDAVRVKEHPACDLVGLREAMKGQKASAANEAFALVLANIIWLLVTFIGEDIAFGLVAEVWPEAETTEAVSAATEGKR
jgi:hypothetical protein